MTLTSLSSLTLFLSVLAVPFFMGAKSARAEQGPGGDDPFKISGPATHDNLSIFFVHGVSTPGAVPLTLAEALARGSVTVHETGQVNQLSVENTGTEPVFIQAGDIVKGGKQDRTLMLSLLLQPKSGKMPIDAFCVEHGRWQARGREDVASFSSAEKLMPLKAAKLAMMEAAEAPAAQPQAQMPVTPGAATNPPSPRQTGAYMASKQQRVWASVAESQSRLSERLASPVAAPSSQSSLQLSLENEHLAKAKAAAISALKNAGGGVNDVLGVVIAINGKISSAEIYPSHGLFVKMWPKLLEAAAVEAIAETPTDKTPLAALKTEDARAFLRSTDDAAAQTSSITSLLTRATRQNKAAVMNETTLAGGALLHRSYVAY